MSIPKYLYIFVALFCGNSTFAQIDLSDSCSTTAGKAEFVLTDYTLLRDSDLVDTLSILNDHFKRCFCENDNASFINDLQLEHEVIVSVEPKIVNLKTCDGLYAFRSFSKDHHHKPHYLNGIMHFVFLVSDNKMYYLNELYSLDSTSVDKRIAEERKHLKRFFISEDIQTMQYLGNQSVYWTDNNIELPLVIYKSKDVLYFDNRRKV
jgi:hypothetical protein